MLYSQKLSRAIKRHDAAVSRIAALNDEVERLESELGYAKERASAAWIECRELDAEVERLRREEKAA